VLYAFQGGQDAQAPREPLIAVDGTLYGVARGGAHGYGAVYAVTLGGTESLLYSFQGGLDGSDPIGGLLEVNGSLYGVTQLGGDGTGFVDGKIFAVSLSGSEQQVAAFKRSVGNGPTGGLVRLGASLYGALTSLGGTRADPNPYGSIYKLTPSGRVRLVYAFTSASPPVSQAYWPVGPLLPYQGALYGVATRGPVADAGTVFRVTPGGTETTLYSFGEGVNPNAGLARVGNVFYGTTPGGGRNGSCGTIFAVAADGTERTVHDFAFPFPSGDGCLPYSGLTAVGDTLYGTTFHGGDRDVGTVFSFRAGGGGYKTIYSFGQYAGDAYEPAGPLLFLGGTLYGTSTGGGLGSGTVFSLTP
jgi:uncharacterized repeat protein (TIGR03803 family)